MNPETNFTPQIIDRGDQFSVDNSALMIERTSTEPRCESSFKPSCSCKAVKIDGPFVRSVVSGETALARPRPGNAGIAAPSKRIEVQVACQAGFIKTGLSSIGVRSMMSVAIVTDPAFT